MATQVLVAVRDSAEAHRLRALLAGVDGLVIVEENPDDVLALLARRPPQLKAWSDIETIVARELGELLGTALHCTPGETRDLVHTSSIPLTSNLVSLQVGLGIDQHTGGQLGERILGGDHSQDAMRDALREMANMAGGAIRRAALDDGMSFAVGLPSNENPFGVPRCRAFTIGDGQGFQLECMIAVSTNVTTHVPAGQLEEGMVLAQNILGNDGDVVHHRGTLLTRTTAASIAGLLGAHATVEVS